MPMTIEVEIDPTGHIRPLTPLPPGHASRATLLLTDQPEPPLPTTRSTATAALALLASARFAHRPAADPNEVQARLAAMRTDWDDDC